MSAIPFYRVFLVFSILLLHHLAVTAQQVCPDNYVMIYNGRNANTDQQLGVAFSADGVNFVKEADPILTFGASGSFDDVHLAQPSIVLHDNQFYLYYSAWSGTKYTVGLAASSDALSWTKVGMVLDVGAPGAWDANLVYMPHVIYDEDAQIGDRWKMWYLGSGSSGFQVGYATSADGQNWTKSNSNPVIPRGTGSDWDVGGIISPTYFEEGGTSYIIYEGYNAGFSESNIGIASFTDPHSVYAKSPSNPVLNNRSEASQLLTENLNMGTEVIEVQNTSLFEADEYVFLTDGNSTETLNRIASINSGTTLTLHQPAGNTYSVSQNAMIKSIYSAKITPCSILESGNETIIYGTAYGALPIQRELCVSFSFDNIVNGWSIDFERGVLGLPILDGPPSVWDYSSLENPAVITCNVQTDIEEHDSNHELTISTNRGRLIVSNKGYLNYQVSDCLGRVLRHGSFDGQTNLTLELFSLTKGMHIISVQGLGGRMYTEKVFLF